MVARPDLQGASLVRKVWSRPTRSRWTAALVLSTALRILGQSAQAQSELPSPAPPPAYPASAPASTATTTTVEELAARLEAMEAMNRRLLEQIELSNQQHDAQMKILFEQLERVSQGQDAIDAVDEAASPLPGGMVVTPEGGEARIETPVPDYTEDQFTTQQPAPGYPLSNLLDDKRLPLVATFGPGFELTTRNEEFRLNVHFESQVEGRVWGPRDSLPADSGISGIYLPRQRIFFDGHITKRLEYEFAINRGLGNLNVLNAFINLHLDDRLQFQFGRFFTPMLYDQYAISNYWMPTPERSLFTTNLSLNRQFGAKAWGYLFDQRLDYAAGLFNGSRNSFENPDGAMDFVGFLNTRPFQLSDSFRALRFLNLGTSVAYGHQDQNPSPVAFRMGAGSPDTNIPGQATVPFLVLDRDVVERGERLVGSVHAAYFYKSLSLLGEWQYGYGSYANVGGPTSSRVPYGGFYVSGGYFLTGEEIERRTRLYPLRPFIPTKSGQRRGPGAWEIVSRYSELSLGNEVFNAGFADPRLWSNSGSTVEVGVNWYWNEYVKLYMFWLHGQFGDPVMDRTGGYRDDADMFWLRFQLYF